jgi:hypothetical protein
MTYTGTIYFLGKYKPLYIQDTAPARVKIRLAHAIQTVADPDLRQWLDKTATHVVTELVARGYSAASCDHCDRGVSLRVGPPDEWIKNLTADMADCPGLNYNA